MDASFWGDTAAHKREVIGLWLWPVIAYLLTVYTDSGMIGVTTLFFLPPAAFLFTQLGNKEHVAIMTAVLSLAVFPVDYIAHATGLWEVQTIFPRVLETGALEDLYWELLIVPYVIGFHERYFDDNTFEYFNRKFSLVAGVSFIAFAALVTGVHLPASLNIPLVYTLVLGPLAFIPLIYGVSQKITSLGYVTVYFGFVHLLHELAALQVGAWHFPLTNTSAIATVTLFGHTVPVEEFIVYMLLMSPAIVCYHHILSRQ